MTHYRLGDRLACQRVLEPLQEDIQDSDSQIRHNLPPSDADRWLPVVRAARTNLALCAGKPARAAEGGARSPPP